MGQIHSGYENSLLLPFNRAFTPEEFLNSLGNVFSKEFFEKSQKKINHYRVFYKALMTLKARREFYLQLLSGNQTLLDQYIEIIGRDEFVERLVYASGQCVDTGFQLVEHMELLIKELGSNTVLVEAQKQKAAIIFQGKQPAFREREAEINAMGDGKEKRALKIKLESDRGLAIAKYRLDSGERAFLYPPNLASACEIAGVCICSNGAEPPYIYSCVADSARLLLTQKNHDKDIACVLQGVVQRILDQKT